jgi:adenylate kinase family enzyme
MKRIIILGRGGAGKSTLAIQLSKLTDIPYVELDKHFWRKGLQPTPLNEWVKVQKRLASADKWIMDGDLGPYDALNVRLHYADTVLMLDFSFIRCAVRAIRRSHERFDFWWWVFTWRRKSRPKILNDIHSYAPRADVHIFRSPKELEKFIANL